jgi:hypothetical protein
MAGGERTGKKLNSLSKNLIIFEGGTKVVSGLEMGKFS